ncbi:hypothetical protein A6R68_11725, partial [Neotoma lepida]
MNSYWSLNYSEMFGTPPGPSRGMSKNKEMDIDESLYSQHLYVLGHEADEAPPHLQCTDLRPAESGCGNCQEYHLGVFRLSLSMTRALSRELFCLPRCLLLASPHLDCSLCTACVSSLSFSTLSSVVPVREDIGKN